MPKPLRLYSFLFGSPLLAQLLGEKYLEDFLDRYILDACSSTQHTLNYLRLFQELNAHSCYHLLQYIEQPTLVVSGLLDVLTPAYLSFELARELKHATHVVCPGASHAALLESPERVFEGLVHLLEGPSSTRYRRIDSSHFERLPDSMSSTITSSSSHMDPFVPSPVPSIKERLPELNQRNHEEEETKEEETQTKVRFRSPSTDEEKRREEFKERYVEPDIDRDRMEGEREATPKSHSSVSDGEPETGEQFD